MGACFGRRTPIQVARDVNDYQSWVDVVDYGRSSREENCEAYENLLKLSGNDYGGNTKLRERIRNMNNDVLYDLISDDRCVSQWSNGILLDMLRNLYSMCDEKDQPDGTCQWRSDIARRIGNLIHNLALRKSKFDVELLEIAAFHGSFQSAFIIAMTYVKMKKTKLARSYFNLALSIADNPVDESLARKQLESVSYTGENELAELFRFKYRKKKNKFFLRSNTEQFGTIKLHIATE